MTPWHIWYNCNFVSAYSAGAVLDGDLVAGGGGVTAGADFLCRVSVDTDHEARDHLLGGTVVRNVGDVPLSYV